MPERVFVSDHKKAQVGAERRSVAVSGTSAISFGFMNRSSGMLDTIPMELGILYAAISDVCPTSPDRQANEAQLFSSSVDLRAECARLLSEMTPQQRQLVFAKAHSLAKDE